jgi:hypothetical protein
MGGGAMGGGGVVLRKLIKARRQVSGVDGVIRVCHRQCVFDYTRYELGLMGMVDCAVLMWFEFVVVTLVDVRCLSSIDQMES